MATCPPHTTTSHGFLPFKILAEKPLLWIGFGALLGWVDLLLCFEGVLRDTVTEKGGIVHDPLFMGFTLAAGCALLLSRRVPLPGRISQGRLPVAAALGAVCSAASVALTAAAESAPGWPALVLGAVAGACAAVLTLAWGQSLARLDLRAALLVVSAGACAQWVLPAIAVCTGFWAHMAFALAAPLLAGWSIGRKNAASEETTDLGLTTGPQPAPILWRMAGAMLAFSLVAQSAWCFFIKMLPGKLEPTLFAPVFLVVIAAVALATLGCALVMERQRSYRLELYYRLAFFVCLAGVGATGVAAADLTQAELFASYATVYVGYSLLGPTMWMLALGYAFMRSTPIRHVAGAVFGAQYLGLFLGFILVEALASGPLASLGQTLGPLVVLLGILALGAVYVALFPERSLLELSPRLFGLSPASIEDRCEQVAAAHGLTPRETQVLSLLARGRDAGFICDELGISRNTVNVHRKGIFAKLSRNTVNVHRKGIFAKLGVHSQQELLSVVEKVSEK